MSDPGSFQGKGRQRRGTRTAFMQLSLSLISIVWLRSLVSFRPHTALHMCSPPLETLRQALPLLVHSLNFWEVARPLSSGTFGV